MRSGKPMAKFPEGGQLAATARLFSSSVIHQMARRGKSPLFSRLVRAASLTDSIDPTSSIRHVFDVAFRFLAQREFRHEYVYKAAIAHKVLLGTHSLRTASMLSEYRVGACKADVVILNGTSTVYEIKSERDRLDRLQTQIPEYLKVFASVNVISGENHVRAVLDRVPTEVGVMVLTERFRISTIREAINEPARIVPSVLFDSLRVHEARRVLEKAGVHVPVAPNTLQRRLLRERFAALDSRVAHDATVSVLRAARTLTPLGELVEALPDSLRAAVLAARLRKQDHDRLLSAVNTPLNSALGWS